MIEEVEAYLDYVLSFKELKRLEMPKFDTGAYTDIEYVKAINEVLVDFDAIDDFDITISHLKGE